MGGREGESERDMHWLKEGNNYYKQRQLLNNHKILEGATLRLEAGLQDFLDHSLC